MLYDFASINKFENYFDLQYSTTKMWDLVVKKKESDLTTWNDLVDCDAEVLQKKKWNPSFESDLTIFKLDLILKLITQV